MYYRLDAWEALEEDQTQLGVTLAEERYCVGTVDEEHAPRIIACVNLLNGLPTELIQRIAESEAYRQQIVLLATHYGVDLLPSRVAE